MNAEVIWPWAALTLLGVFHGLNPGMGWLFAVGLGLQEKQRQAVFRAMPPLALGHALSIGAVVLAMEAIQVVLPAWLLPRLCGGVLIAFGLYRLFRARHVRWVGMRVGFRDLTLWSFLMASAHGAGLMLVPVLLQWPVEGNAHARVVQDLSPDVIARSPALMFLAVGVHTTALLLVTTVVAVVVYEKLGLAFLRWAWVNVDGLWAVALLIAGGVALV